jgi:hypothetical protein
VANIFDEIFECRQPSSLSMPLDCGVAAAERHQRLTSRRMRLHSALHVFVDEHFDVAGHLGFEISILAGLEQHRSNAPERLINPADHRFGSSAG